MDSGTKTISEKDVNIHIGQKLKFRRLFLGMTLDQVAKLAGVSFQQIQKYETGKNSVSAMKLVQLANILGVDGNYFLEQLITTTATSPDNSLILNANDKNLVELVKAYHSIDNHDDRQKLTNLALSIHSYCKA